MSAAVFARQAVMNMCAIEVSDIQQPAEKLSVNHYLVILQDLAILEAGQAFKR
jgi:hypothetical protein